MIAFVMAFVFRGFVIEAFLIPTGSMAPTMLGAHMRFQSPETGYNWTVGPWFPPGGQPEPIQGEQGRHPPVRVTDPMTGLAQPRPATSSGIELQRVNVPRRSGDRIFVLKYLYSLFDPARFDVVVFKNPTNPDENFIKRLLGLPGEQVALVDGDVFARQPRADDDPDANPWTLPGWEIQRKPERAQREAWYRVFDSRFAPPNPSRPFRVPWRSDERGWTIGNAQSYRYEGTSPTELVWDTNLWPITDFLPYNEIDPPGRGRSPFQSINRFPTSDLRLVAGVEPDEAGVRVEAIVEARGHEFRAVIDDRQVRLEKRPGPASSWQTLGEGSLRRPLPPGSVTKVEFWHVDQSLSLWVEGRRVAFGTYDWSPAERIRHATGEPLEEVLDLGPAALTDSRNYRPARPSWRFSGGSLTLHNVALWRDFYFQPIMYPPTNANRGRHGSANTPGLATHPATTPTLGPDQFYVCGDNSAASADSRLWDEPDPWVAELIDDSPGVVHRDLMIGKAFFVYFPSLHSRGRFLIPDFGRMRFLW